MGRWGFVGLFCVLFLSMGDCDVLGRSWVEVRSDGNGSKIGLGRSATRMDSVFRC